MGTDRFLGNSAAQLIALQLEGGGGGGWDAVRVFSTLD
jgi:hypothetical protein